MSKALDYLVISQEELDLRYNDWLDTRNRNPFLIDNRVFYGYYQWKNKFYCTYKVWDNLKSDYIRDDSGNIKVITTLKKDYKSFNRNPFFIAQKVDENV
jgi:hypothetical protein